jgi:hypothetical protein
MPFWIHYHSNSENKLSVAEALITIKNTTNPSNPFVVLNSAKIYNEATQLSLQQGFTPSEYGRYRIEVRDRANGVLAAQSQVM